MSSFSMRLDRTLMLLEAEDEPSSKDDVGSVNRRSFLASAASSVAGGPNLSNVIGGLGTSGLSELIRDEDGEFDHAYYTGTPVEVWLPTMSPAGIRALKAQFPGTDLGTTLAAYELRGKELFDDQDSISKSINRIRLIGKHWNLKSSKLLDAIRSDPDPANALIERFGDIKGQLRYRDILKYKNWKTVVNNLDNFFRQNASSMNVTIDAGHGAAVQRFTNTTKLWERLNLKQLRNLDDNDLQMRRQKKSEDEQRHAKDDKDYELDLVRWSGEGGASGPNESYIRKLSRIFECRLNAIVETMDDPEYDDYDYGDPKHSDRYYDDVFHGVEDDNEPDPWEDFPGGGLPTSEDSVEVNAFSKEVIGNRIDEFGKVEGYVVMTLKKYPYEYASWDQLIAEVESHTGKAWVLEAEPDDDTAYLIPKAIEDLTALESRRGRVR